MNRYLQFLRRFSDRNILVIGDVMLDKFIWGTVTRISPEAPVQIVNVEKETFEPGGAANVAANIGALAKQTSLFGVMGKDLTRDILTRLLIKRRVNMKGIIIDKDKPTVQKVRVMGQHQQLLRFDYEKPEYLSSKDEQKMLEAIKKQLRSAHAVVVSDYAKGTITKQIMTHLISLCNKRAIPIIIDPKPKHREMYTGCTLLTPNHKEACEMLQQEVDNAGSILTVGRKLASVSDANILITRGEKGMSLFQKDDQVIHIPTKAREVYDVTGAGDTVLAVLALALAAGARLDEAAEMANHAAGIVVGKIGTATVSLEELQRSLEDA